MSAPSFVLAALLTLLATLPLLATPPAAAKKSARVRVDCFGDPLPAGVLGRMGSVRMRGFFGDSIALSSDGKLLALAGYGGVALWDVATGKPLRRFHRVVHGRLGDYDHAYQIAFTPDGKSLAGIDDSELFLLDVRSWKILWNNESFEHTLALSPSGRLLAVPGDNKMIRLLHSATGKLVRTLPARKKGINSLAFSTDGKSLASASDGIDIWDVASGKHRLRLRGSDETAWINLAFAAHDRLAAGSWGDSRVWDARTGKQLRQVTVDKDWATALSPDGEILATADLGTAHLWSVATGKLLRSLRGHTRGVSALVFSGNGKQLVSAGWNGTISLWDVATGKELRPIGGHRGDINCVTFSPRGDRLASVGDDGRLCLWDARSYRLLRELAFLEHPLWHVAFSPDGTQLLTTGGDGQVRLWDAATGKQRQRFPGARRSRPEHWYPQVVFKGGHPFTAAFSPDGKAVAAGNASGDLCLWDTRTGQRQRILERETRSPVLVVAFTPDGKRLLSADGEEPLARHELPGGRTLDPLPATGGRHLSVIPSVDGMLLFPQGEDCLWDLATRKPINPFDKARFPDGRDFYGYVMSYSPDGRLAVCMHSYPDDKFAIWEVASAQLAHEIAAEPVSCSKLYFSPDSRRIVSTDHGTYTLSVWDATGLAGEEREAAGPLTRPQLLQLWRELADHDARKAYRARWQLTAHPAEALPFLKEQLKPVAPVAPARLARLLAELGDDHYPVRQRALKELTGMREAAAAALRRELASNGELEVRKRMRSLLSALAPRASARLREARAVAVLETLGTREARTPLHGLLAGVAEARLTREARAALERLARRPAE